MKRYLHQKELLWVSISGLIIWNIGLTLQAPPLNIVTLDMATVVRVAAQQLAEVSEGKDLDAAKDNLADRLRASVQAFALKHKAIVVDSGTIIAGATRDITAEVIKEVTR